MSILSICMYPQQIWQPFQSLPTKQKMWLYLCLSAVYLDPCLQVIWTIWKDDTAKRDSFCCCSPVLYHDDVTKFPECSFLNWWLNHRLHDENKMQHTVFLDLPLMFGTERKMSDKWTVNLVYKHKRSPTCIPPPLSQVTPGKKNLSGQTSSTPTPQPLSSASEVSMLIGSWNSETYFNK